MPCVRWLCQGAGFVYRSLIECQRSVLNNSYSGVVSLRHSRRHQCDMERNVVCFVG